MSLTQTWLPYFHRDARLEGQEDQAQGRVERVSAEGEELVRALVSDDGESQTVTIGASNNTATAECTCDRFAAGSFCRHIWALLLDLQHAQTQGQGNGVMAQLTEASPRPPKARKRRITDRVEPEAEPRWMGRLTLLRPSSMETAEQTAPNPFDRRQVLYALLPEASANRHAVVIETRYRQPTVTGWSSPRALKVHPRTLGELQEPIDRQITALLLGSGNEEDMASRPRSTFELSPGAARLLLRRIARTGRCAVDGRDDKPARLTWDGDKPWVLWAVGRTTEEGLELALELRRGDERMGIHEPTLAVGGPQGVAIYQRKAAPLDDRGATAWLNQFREGLGAQRRAEPMLIPAQDVGKFLDRLFLLPHLPELDLPEELARTPRRVPMQPRLEVFSSEEGGRASQPLTARVFYEYEQHRLRPDQAGHFAGVESGQPIQRDLEAEQAANEQLLKLGFRPNPADPGRSLLLRPKRMADALSELAERGWVIEADERPVRRGGAPSISISSGTDWLELRGSVRFETADGQIQEVGLPEILAAARAGRSMVRLSDGSEGMLPQQWLREHSLLTSIGQAEEDHLRFRSSQAALLDALLSQRDVVDADERFETLRRRLRQVDRVQPLDPAESFEGNLRPYQSQGLGWLVFLRQIGMGGVLADDMGLGKTIQVLAMLDARYANEHEDEPHRPTLVVAPRSVVYNWLDEAARFTPRLRVVGYTGAERQALLPELGEVDLVITSYGLLRRDIDRLLEQGFDYVVLDEAQTIKNPKSQAARAAYLLNARHRLALTGTPVENHMGDLWSIFEFLNPGMLGSGARFSKLLRRSMRDPRSKQAAAQAGRALRPFILRRTKSQVLKDLPEKTEQTIVCKMGSSQRKTYDQLLAHYRGRLLKHVDSKGVGGSTMMVLEALLRLRQAACHVALIDSQRHEEPSAKLDELFERLEETTDEGHKSLVFSQFTSLLSLVRQRLDAAGVKYEYLDGQTRDRQARIERFQNDDECRVFLISLKAGGLGLNLTAADYVFLLDPWWNPAVEAQAIDRAHRIGQTRPVFAYRLVCQDTVEQRIIELQAQKRELADAIVGGEGNMLTNLTRDDLEKLLS